MKKFWKKILQWFKKKPKTKIYKLVEWNVLVSQRKVREKDLKNGEVGHLPIECPDTVCLAKIWDFPEELNYKKRPGQLWPVRCEVCSHVDHRMVAFE